ncbi:MAG: hypothetical protein FWE27_09000 [Defluviitaleaceae bacterium]|nr:hypothetical protein [Defluviitaleaceae bacterium]
MGKIKIIGLSFLGLILIVVSFFAIRYALNPLRHSDVRIRENILKLTPIGSTIEDVIQVIESNEAWEWNGRIADIGYQTHSNTTALTGAQSIRVTLGTYSNGFIVYVVSFWGFDEEGILLDVRIWKAVAGF